MTIRECYCHALEKGCLVLARKSEMKRVEADEIRDADDVCGMDLELPSSTLTLLVGSGVSVVDGGGGGDHVEFQEALCSMSTLPKQCGLTPSRSFRSHMLPALITMDLLYPLLSPEQFSLTLMAIWQSSLPTTLSDLGGNSIGLKNLQKICLKNRPRVQFKKDTCMNCFKSYTASIKKCPKIAEIVA